MTELGLDPRSVIVRLEDWFLENHAFPLNREGWAWPGARSAAIFDLVIEHAGMHAVPALWLQNGEWVPAPRCPDSPCKVSGASYALWELQGHLGERKSPEVAVMRRLDDEAVRLAASEPAVSEALRARAHEIRAGLTSRDLREPPGGGRPKLTLAHALVQHLRMGGFTFPEIAFFLGSTEGACRGRFNRDDRRTLVPFREESNANGHPSASTD